MEQDQFGIKRGMHGLPLCPYCNEENDTTSATCPNPNCPSRSTSIPAYKGQKDGAMVGVHEILLAAVCLFVGALIGVGIATTHMPNETMLRNDGDQVAIAVDYEHLAVFEYKDGEWIRTTKEYPPMPPSPKQARPR